jgi:PAS domain S-box-containing protein
VKATEVVGTTHAWKAFYDRERPVLSNLLVENKHEKIQELYAGKFNRSKYIDGAYEVTDFFPRMGRYGIWLYYTAAVLRDSRGTIVGAVETLEDITDWKNAERELRASNEQITASEEELRHQCDELKKGEDALRESEMRYHLLTECMKDVIWQMDTDMTFTYISPSVLQQCGYTPEEVVGRKLFEFITPESEKNVQRQMAKRTEQNTERFFRGSATYILEQVRKDGSILVTEVVTNTVFDEAENFIGWLGITRDISERTSAEEELGLANRKLKLLSGITRHDINNQVTVLQSCINLLEMKQSDPASDVYFQKANTAAERISAMIRFTHEYESIGINTPIWKNCHILVETATRQIPLGNITVKNDLPAGTEVFADLLIVKVFYNLLDNAVKYGGKITTVRFSVEQRNGDHIIICEDDGVGVPPMEKEQIFKRGFGKNTGLGLFLCREILSITGITICEAGEQGTGARFEITVPHSSIRV